ncbi:conjugal transfer protein TraI [Xanthomonas phaseoli pv. manihotis str. CIO151]|nr:conjugal transfer protein TraI [Xanthomonas phaseoli pv. manihotis str. CIO151]
MKQCITLLCLVAMLAGCASKAAVVPALEGRARVPVNKQIPAQAPVTQQPNSSAQGE